MKPTSTTTAAADPSLDSKKWKWLDELPIEKTLKGYIGRCEKCDSGDGEHDENDDTFCDGEKCFCSNTGKRLYQDDDDNPDPEDDFRQPPPDSWQRIQLLRAHVKKLEAQQTDTLSELRTQLIEVRNDCRSAFDRAKASKNIEQQIASFAAVNCYQHAINLIDSAKAEGKE